MSDNKNNSSSIAAVVAGASQGAPPAVINRLLAILEAQEADRQAAIDLQKKQEAERKAQALAVRDTNIRQVRAKAEEDRLKQSACRHRVGAAGNFATALAGFTMVSGRLHLVCQECGREFSTPEAILEVNRQGLMPPAENIAAAPRA